MSDTIAILLSHLTGFKQGWKTSEFWVTLSPVIMGILSVLGVHGSSGATAHFVVVAWGAVAATYVAGRTFVKSVHIGHAANLAVLLKQAEKEGLSAAEVLAHAGIGGKVDEPKTDQPPQLFARAVDEDVPPAPEPAPPTPAVPSVQVAPTPESPVPSPPGTPPAVA